MAKTWLITGANSGFGKLMTEALLARGDSVAALVRTPETLQAIVDPECGAAHQIGFDDTVWAEQLVAVDAAVQKLSAYLDQGQLSLRSARELFHETFV